MSTKIRCFFDVEIDAIPAGRIIFELFANVCPKTCDNFRALCTGEKGIGEKTDVALHYRGVKFHRVIKGFMVQGGDFSAGNGTGGESIYGGQFKDENFDLVHDQPFLLSMANRGENTNGSQFFITTQPAPHLDGKHVVFGRVVSGQEVVLAVEDLPIDNRSRPLQLPTIANCGELVLQRTIKIKQKKVKKKKIADESLSSSEDESSEKKKKKKKKNKEKEKKEKKKKKKQRKQKRKESSVEEEEEEEEEEEGEVKDEDTIDMKGAFYSHPLVSVTHINPEEIPEIPRNRFLYRAAPDPDGDERRDVYYRERGQRFGYVRAYTKSGRKVKGRGSMRYRTPSRSRSRSRTRTPPHWRQAQRSTISMEQFHRKNDDDDDEFVPSHNEDVGEGFPPYQDGGRSGERHRSPGFGRGRGQNWDQDHDRDTGNWRGHRARRYSGREEDPWKGRLNFGQRGRRDRFGSRPGRGRRGYMNNRFERESNWQQYRGSRERSPYERRRRNYSGGDEECENNNMESRERTTSDRRHRSRRSHGKMSEIDENSDNSDQDNHVGALKNRGRDDDVKDTTEFDENALDYEAMDEEDEEPKSSNKNLTEMMDMEIMMSLKKKKENDKDIAKEKDSKKKDSHSRSKHSRKSHSARKDIKENNKPHGKELSKHKAGSPPVDSVIVKGALSIEKQYDENETKANNEEKDKTNSNSDKRKLREISPVKVRESTKTKIDDNSRDKSNQDSKKVSKDKLKEKHYEHSRERSNRDSKETHDKSKPKNEEGSREKSNRDSKKSKESSHRKSSERSHKSSDKSLSRSGRRSRDRSREHPRRSYRETSDDTRRSYRRRNERSSERKHETSDRSPRDKSRYQQTKLGRDKRRHDTSSDSSDSD